LFAVLIAIKILYAVLSEKNREEWLGYCKQDYKKVEFVKTKRKQRNPLMLERIAIWLRNQKRGKYDKHDGVIMGLHLVSMYCF
jgi:hypothetical protein